MSGNRHRAGKGWPAYGRKDFAKGPAANYRPRKRGPAQTPKMSAVEEAFDAIEVVATEEVVAYG